MARKKSGFISALGILWEIWRALVAEVLSRGGSDDDLRRIKDDPCLRREIASLIIEAGRKTEESRPNAQTFDLGDGFVFTVDETVELEVDGSTSSKDILRRGGHDPGDWEHLGEQPESGTRMVRAAIGRLNRPWTEEELTALLTKPGCPLKGSGAWGGEAFLKVRPSYDGKGWIGFPDSNTSRWRHRSDGGVYFPRLWRVGTRWYRHLRSVRYGWHAENRVCLLFVE